MSSSPTCTEDHLMNPLEFLPTPLSLVTDSLEGSTESVQIVADSLVEITEDGSKSLSNQLESTPNQYKSRLYQHPILLEFHTDQLRSISSEEVQSLKYRLQQMSQCFHEFQVEHEREKALMEQTNWKLENELNTYKQTYQNKDSSNIIIFNKSLQQELSKLHKENKVIFPFIN